MKLLDVFQKEIYVAVFVKGEYYETFCEVLTNSVRCYKADRMKIDKDTVFAMKMTPKRYEILIDECDKANIPLAAYSKTKYLHRIVK